MKIKINKKVATVCVASTLTIVGGALLSSCFTHDSPGAKPAVVNLIAVKGGQSGQPCSQTTQVGLNGCSGNALASADAALNRQLRFLFEQLPATGTARSHLVASESAWLKERASLCQLTSNAFAGGSIRSMMVSDCKTRADQGFGLQLKSLYVDMFQGSAHFARWPH